MPRSPALLGTYRTPRYRLGQVVTCEVHGDVRIVGTSAGRIPWPLGRKTGSRGYPALVVYGDLLKAMRRESGQAVQYWFGMAPCTTSKYRKTLGVPMMNEGTLAAAVKRGKSKAHRMAMRAMWATAHDPERCRKISESRRGNPRPKHVVEAMVRGRLAKGVSAETRRKISEANKRNGSWPPAAGVPWSADELRLLRTKVSSREIAERTGRTQRAVQIMRRRRGLSLRGR